MQHSVKIEDKTYALSAEFARSQATVKLDDLSGRDLVELYNALSDNPVKKFADKATALKRTWAMVQEKGEAVAKRRGAPKRGYTFDFSPKDEVRAPREGSSRAAVLALLVTGATFDEVMAATWGKRKGWDADKKRKTTYEGIRLCHLSNGYGLRQDEKGRIFAFAK